MYTQFQVESHFEGKLQIVYLDQPETLNALTKPALAELKDFFQNANDNETLRCIAISGKGKAFCSGQNLEEAVVEGNKHHERHVIQKIVTDYYNPLVKSIIHCKKPVVSLVNGAAVGAGAMLALICDFTLATKNSYFAQAFVKIGLIPDTGGTYFLPKLLGRQMANYLTFTGKKLYAEEAKNLGLIAEVFSEEDFTKNSLEILENICNLPTKAIDLTKRAFTESYGNTLSEQLELESKLQQKAAHTHDFMEGVSAFLEKRKPNYKGN